MGFLNLRNFFYAISIIMYISSLDSQTSEVSRLSQLKDIYDLSDKGCDQVDSLLMAFNVHSERQFYLFSYYK